MTQSAGFFPLYRSEFPGIPVKFQERGSEWEREIITQEKHEYGLGKMETTYNSVVESQFLVLWLNAHDDDLLLSPPGSVVPVSTRVRRDVRNIAGVLLS